MLNIQSLEFSYPTHTVFSDLNLQIDSPGIHLITGPTGTGKSTLLEIIAGSTPLFKGGSLMGEIYFNGLNLKALSQRERVQNIGFVGQDPESTFVSQTVFDEIAFSLRFFEMNPREVATQVQDIAEAFNIAPMLYREIDTLSAGQQQRVAIAAALVAKPQLLLLDEPTSALDQIMSHELNKLLHDYSSENDVFVLLSEHRTDRLLEFATTVTLLDSKTTLSPIESLAYLSTPSTFEALHHITNIERSFSTSGMRNMLGSIGKLAVQVREPAFVQDAKLMVQDAHVDIDSQRILSEINLSFSEGSVTALIGENGSGKTTLIHSIIGDIEPQSGSITFRQKVTSTLHGKELLRSFGIVPSNPQDVFLSHTVMADCELADKDRGLVPGQTCTQFQSLAPEASVDAHPRDLSSGQQLALALAIALSSNPDVLLLDEPTRGLDGETKTKIMKELLRRKQSGTIVILATHDMELVAELADHVVLLAEGRIYAEGSPQEILGATFGFHTITSKIFEPLPFLTIDDVRHAYQHA